MTILRSDIKLMKSQRMENTPDGGGQITGEEILDGEHNSIFPDISDLNRTYGKVDIMKTFLSVSSTDTDKYFGSNIAIIEPPEDDSVSMTIMSTRDHYDERSDAREFIESYLARGAAWSGTLYSNQLEGQRVIRFTQRTSVSIPSVGEVLVLTENHGLVDEFEQYIRIVKVESTPQEFLIQGYPDAFTRNVINCEISEPLRYTFSGYPPSPYDSGDYASSISETVVANAAKYYGVRKVTNDALLGDLTIKADGIYSQLVPSSRTETPIIDVNASGKRTALTPSGEPFTFTTTVEFSANKSIFLGNSVTPGGFSVTIGAAVMTDLDGDVILGGDVIGTLDYDRGFMLFNGTAPSYVSDTKVITYQPASPVQNATDSLLINITTINRGYAYVASLVPLPKAASCTVSFIVQGKWYTMTDKGDGALRGSDPSVGSGSLDLNTGSLILTLGALPDVDTSILIQWGTNVDITDASAKTTEPSFKFDVANVKAITEGTVLITWDGGSATDNDSFVVVDYYNGIIDFTPAVITAKGTEYTVAWDEDAVKKTVSATLIDSGASVVFTIVNGNVKPNSLEFVLPLTVDGYDLGADYPVHPSQYVQYLIKDDGSGNLRLYEDPNKPESSIVGTVNYTNGSVVINKQINASALTQTWVSKGVFIPGKVLTRREYTTTACSVQIATIPVPYTQVSTSDSKSEVVSPVSLKIETTLSEGEVITKESLNFKFSGEYFVEQSGKLYRNVNRSTGVGEEVGTVDAINGIITITNWAVGVTDFVLNSIGATFDAAYLTTYVAFRTPGAPVAPGSLFMQCVDGLGASQSVSVSSTGEILDGIFSGYFNHETGVVELITSSTIDIDSLRFNCVVYDTIPLEADLIGLDPVRLPSDGRVPIFIKGDVVVIHQTEKTLHADLQPNRVIDSGQTRLAELYLEDLAGNRINEIYYTIDPNAGTLTTLGTFPAQDANLVFRFEDMSLLIDVDISGQLKLARQLSHNYDADVAYVSSVLIADDLWSRYSTLFDQQTWTNEWEDYLIGNETSAEFNDALAPIIVTNEGAITERWAIIFTGTNNFKLLGEHVGQIAVGTIDSQFAPLNPNTGVPYFTINHAGWGSGWATGNVLRFNTQGAIFPFWNIRTILQGEAEITEDNFKLQLRGNINKD